MLVTATSSDYLQTMVVICGSVFPIFGIFVALTLGLKLFLVVAEAFRDTIADDPPESPEWVRQILLDAQTVLGEKRKNDAPEEKEKPTAWQLGDDGEMVPVVPKRKNDDMFHMN